MEQSTPAFARSPAGGAAASQESYASLLESRAIVLPDAAQWTQQALLELFDAHRQDGEAFAECFQRLGAPRYAAMLGETGAGTTA